MWHSDKWKLRGTNFTRVTEVSASKSSKPEQVPDQSEVLKASCT